MENVKSIYNQIADCCLAQVSGHWNIISIAVEFYGTAAQFDIEVEYLDGKKEDLDSSYDLFKLFAKLHDITTENGSNQWNKAIFKLEYSGQFNVDFSFDPDLED